MPKGKKGFQKGQVANPKGINGADPQIQKIRQLTREEVGALLTLMMDNNVAALKDIVTHPESTAFRVLVATIMLKAIQNGDYRALDSLLSRIIGRVEIKVDNTSSDGSMTPRTANVFMIPAIPKGERKAILSSMAHHLEVTADEEVKKK